MLVTMKEILDRAAAGNYGVAAPNVSSEFDARACLEVAEDLKSPLILDVFYGATSDIYFFGHLLRDLAEQAKVPVCINLDHGGKKEQIIKAMQSGFTSVMIDRSDRDAGSISGHFHPVLPVGLVQTGAVGKRKGKYAVRLMAM